MKFVQKLVMVSVLIAAAANITAATAQPADYIYQGHHYHYKYHGHYYNHRSHQNGQYRYY